MLLESIVVLTLSLLKEAFACTEPSLSMCECRGTEVYCNQRNLRQIPSNIPNDTTVLWLYTNKIQSIDATSFSGLTSLQQLRFSHNEISSIEDGAFSSLRSLVTLSLSVNKLKSIQPDLFKSLGALRTLRLSDNEISSIEDGAFSSLRSLVTLSLSVNKLKSIQPDLFKSLGALRTLGLSENEISSIEDGAFSSLRSLVDLDLEDNQLKTVSASIFADFTDIQKLYLRFNPLVCCKMTDLIDWWSNQPKRMNLYGYCTDFKTRTDLDEFDLSNCTVDGGWGSWSNPICSVTCGNGIQSRNRSCDSPVPSLGGQTCNGSSVNTSDCSLIDCPVDGGWGSWSNPTCSATCGNGIQSRNRSCDSPAPSAGGETCNGSSVETSDCSSRDCPVDGGWGSWSNPICSVTCGNGILSRNRSCDSPVPSEGGETCHGSSVDTSDCSLIDCPCIFDGQWGSWSTGPCSVTCGNGIRYRKRSCDSPPASNNGKGCIGSCTVSVICILEVCPESRKWKRYHAIRLNSRRYHGRRLNSRRYHGRRLNSRRYHGRRLKSRRYHGRRLNSRRYHGRRLNSRRYHGTD